MDTENVKKKKIGRPKKRSTESVAVNEENVETLRMTQKSDNLTLSDLTNQYKKVFQTIAYGDSYTKGKYGYLSHTAACYNQLNPFLQNQRLKNLYTSAKTYNKADIMTFTQDPGSHESDIRGLGWSQSGSQQIYYNILRRACDIPLYKYYVIPEKLEFARYSKSDFENEYKLVNQWLQVFDVPTTLKTMALQIKREGKQSYLLRNKITTQGTEKEVNFVTLQKMPTDWVKITGIGQLGYTISFNMMYFMNIANCPARFGPFIEKAWADLIEKGVVIRKNIEGTGLTGQDSYELNTQNAFNYSFTYQGQIFKSILETRLEGKGRACSYFFWLEMPWDICFTFGSDNSNPWVAPDTMGLLQQLQELSDYSQLAGLIASTPLTAVLTGEIETITGARAGKNESIFSPEIIRGYQDMFNSATSTNVEAWMWPAKNIKLQQLNADVNSSDITTKATQNFVTNSGEGGLTITADKPNVSQVKTAQLLAASQQEYVTLQFARVLNFIINNKLGFNFKWKLNLWGDIFSFENEKKFLKEMVAGGAVFFLPKLLSAEDLTLNDTKAIVDMIKSLDFYKDLQTFTALSSQNMKNTTDSTITQSVGRPPLDESDIENDATAKSREAGDNTAENRMYSAIDKHICPICGADIEDDEVICEECRESILERTNEKGE